MGNAACGHEPGHVAQRREEVAIGSSTPSRLPPKRMPSRAWARTRRAGTSVRRDLLLFRSVGQKGPLCCPLGRATPRSARWSGASDPVPRQWPARWPSEIAPGAVADHRAVGSPSSSSKRRRAVCLHRGPSRKVSPGSPRWGSAACSSSVITTSPCRSSSRVASCGPCRSRARLTSKAPSALTGRSPKPSIACPGFLIR
jgi:hypothetical protein